MKQQNKNACASARSAESPVERQSCPTFFSRAASTWAPASAAASSDLVATMTGTLMAPTPRA